MISIQNFQFNPFQTNCRVIYDETRECVICDPCMYNDDEKQKLDDFISANSLKPCAIILTHGHGDHSCAVSYCMKKYGVEAYMSDKDDKVYEQHAALCVLMGMDLEFGIFPHENLKEEDVISFGSHSLIVIESPGHTPGGLCFLCPEEKFLLSGDTLFKGSIGRTDLYGGDYDVLMESLQGKLMGLAGDIAVLPGHGADTSIAEEIQTNPFLMPFNEEIDYEDAAENAIEPNLKDE